MFLAACGSDNATQPGDNLSADQVQSMATALRTLIALSLFTEDASVASTAHVRARSVMSTGNPITGTRACPAGGYFGVDGSFSPDDDGHIVFAISDTLVNCAIRDSKSNVWTFTSQPTLEISIIEGFDSDSTDASRLIVQETDAGRVSYGVGSLSGSCSINAEIHSVFASHTPTADSNTVTLHTTGTLCGRSLASDTSYTTPAPTPPSP